MELYQFPYSPYCIIQRRILEFSGAKFKIINIPNGDRTLIWKITRQRYYQVPVLKDGKNLLFETGDNSQVIAKYLDDKLELGLFPKECDGLQDILWAYVENDIEGLGFKLNDVHYRENVDKASVLGFIRHKERKFGRGCLEKWAEQAPAMLEELEQKLLPCEQMLQTRDYLLNERPHFIDFSLYGILGNFLYSGHYTLPASTPNLADWYQRMTRIKHSQLS